MSNLLKIAIPLLNDKLTLEDIDEKNGFVGAYFDDKNRPSLTNHLFLLYDAECKEKEFANVLYKLNNLDNKYSNKVIHINEKPYFVYTFTVNKTINHLRDGNIFLSDKQKQDVLKFWNWKDAWIANNVLLGALYEHPEESTLPEEDYAPDLFDAYKEGGVLI